MISRDRTYLQQDRKIPGPLRPRPCPPRLPAPSPAARTRCSPARGALSTPGPPRETRKRGETAASGTGGGAHGENLQQQQQHGHCSGAAPTQDTEPSPLAPLLTPAARSAAIAR
ncbi:uncharacterized protein LOC119543407 isoform X2 [Choloepus didactylus]|uniref:uncharacterized protein LOC119543407 isoform X2 n=1 Tax=Choloepus didactylus TaxID=27675 RepID=UPI00189DD9D9|nr:uncharacterized protein LOC119543407 isoform X2 [Choloepus didactylus]